MRRVGWDDRQKDAGLAVELKMENGEWRMENGGTNPADLIINTLSRGTWLFIKEIRKDFHLNCPLSILNSPLSIARHAALPSGTGAITFL